MTKNIEQNDLEINLLYIRAKILGIEEGEKNGSYPAGLVSSMALSTGIKSLR